jgi:hypothetical protein
MADHDLVQHLRHAPQPSLAEVLAEAAGLPDAGRVLDLGWIQLVLRIWEYKNPFEFLCLHPARLLGEPAPFPHQLIAARDLIGHLHERIFLQEVTLPSSEQSADRQFLVGECQVCQTVYWSPSPLRAAL